MLREGGEEAGRRLSEAAGRLVSADGGQPAVGGSPAGGEQNGYRFCRHPKDISTEAYVLYRAAQDIYEGTRYIGAAELVDRKLASGRMFRLICRAMELARMNQ